MTETLQPQERKWDVAISLLAEDERYGAMLVDEISRHVRGEIFFYSRNQEGIARDGKLVELFNRVFDHEARVAVVLYREGWGATQYTALEQDALRARRLREGARGFIIVSMDGGFPASWYPADYFRPSAKEFTLEQIAAVVAERVEEAGGSLGIEPAVEKARRLEAERTQRDKLNRMLLTAGPVAIEEQARRLYDCLKDLASQVTADGKEPMSYDERSRRCRVNYQWGSLVCEWHRRFKNSLEGTELAFSIKDSATELSGRHQAGQARILQSGTFDISLPQEDLWAWRLRSLKRRRRIKTVMVTEELANWLIGELLDWTSGDKPPRAAPRGSRRTGWLDSWKYR